MDGGRLLITVHGHASSYRRSRYYLDFSENVILSELPGQLQYQPRHTTEVVKIQITMESRFDQFLRTPAPRPESAGLSYAFKT